VSVPDTYGPEFFKINMKGKILFKIYNSITGREVYFNKDPHSPYPYIITS